MQVARDIRPSSLLMGLFLWLAASPAAAADGARFERLASGSANIKRVSIGRKNAKDRLTIIHLHQIGKPIGDETFDRVVAAMRSTRRLSAEIISVPWFGHAYSEPLEREIRGAKDKSIVVMGHGRGGGSTARDLATWYPEKIRQAVLINPLILPQRPSKVPTLVIRGEHDTDDGRGANQYQWDAKMLGRQLDTPAPLDENGLYYPVPGADTGLRFRPPGQKGTIDSNTEQALAKSAETRALNGRVGQAIVSFLKGEQPPPALPVPRAKEKPTPKRPPVDQVEKRTTRKGKPRQKKKSTQANADNDAQSALGAFATTTRKLGRGGPLTIVHFFRRAENAGVGVFRTLGEELEAAGVSASLVGVPWEIELKELDDLEAAIRATKGRNVVLSGHGGGGGLAWGLADDLADKVRAMVLINSSVPADYGMKVPTLVMRAEYDVDWMVKQDLRELREPRKNVTWVPVAGADRGLRYLPDGPGIDRTTQEALNTSPKTLLMRQAVSKTVAAFLKGEALPDWVEAAQADLGVAGKSPARAKKKPAPAKKKPAPAKQQRTKSPETSAFEKLGYGDYRSTVVPIGPPDAEDQVTVLHLHGAHKPTGYELFGRLADGLEVSGKLAGTAISVPWESPRAEHELEEAVRGAKKKSLVITGHAAACYLIYRLARQYPSKFRTVVVLNPRFDAREGIPVPTLFVRGEHSPAVNTEVEARVMAEASPPNVLYYQVPHADHSLRRRTSRTRGRLSREEKLQLARSPETVRLSREVGRAIASFVVDGKVPAQVNKSRAKINAPLARALWDSVRELPRDVRRRVARTLAANDRMLELLAKDRGRKAAPMDEIRREQRSGSRKALRKVFRQRGREPRSHGLPPEVQWLRPPNGSRREVQVVRYSQPEPNELYWKIIEPAESKGIKPKEIAVINLRLENNSEARWPREYSDFNGLKMIDAGYLDHSVPPLDQVKQVLQTMLDPKLKLVVLHCYAGRARTGTMTAAMRIALDGWTAARALNEAEENGLQRPIQRRFIRWFAQQVKSGKFKL